MSSVRIGWTAVGGATHYKVYGSNNGINFFLLQDNIAGLTFTHDAGHTLRWWYRVASANAEWESPPSTAVTLSDWPPEWLTPFTIQGAAGQQIDVSVHSADRDSSTRVHTLVAPIPSGYSMTQAGVLTLGAATANVTMMVTAGGKSATTTVQAVVSAIPVATFAVSVSGSTVTTRRVSSGAVVYTGTVISQANIGAAAGNIIEFAAGTYPKITLGPFTGTSLANPVTVRNKSGEVAIIQGTSFPFEMRGNTYFTVDGSNGMAAWNPYMSTLAHGFRVTVPTTTTTPTGYLKHFGLHKGIRYKRIEIDGRKALVTGGMMNVTGSDIGFATNDQTQSSTAAANNGKWGNDDVELIECYTHNTGGEGAYLGVNFNTILGGAGLPNKDVRATRCRFVHAGSGGAQLKSCWGGTNNGFYGCVALYTGNDLGNFETGHGHGLQAVGNGAIQDCWVEQTREAGIKSYWDDGPNPVVDANSPTGYSQVIGTNRWPVYNVYEMEISNNVILRAGGTPCVDGVAQTGPVFIGGTRPTPITLVAHGIAQGGNATAKFRPKIISNTILDCEENGVNLGAVVTGGIVSNNLILGSGAAAMSGTSGQTVQGNITSGTKANIFQNYVANFVQNGPNADDLHLKIAQGPAVGTSGTHYTTTDKDGDPRVSPPDVGAYEYP